MRYRKLDANGDYSFGRFDTEFLIDSPEVVAQAIKTRLGLIQGEWFPDPSVGVPYPTKVFGANHGLDYDSVIKGVILETPGVLEIVDYASYSDTSRKIHISCIVNTQYGQTTIGV